MENFFRVYILSSKHEEGLGEFKKVKQTRLKRLTDAVDSFWNRPRQKIWL